MNVSDKQEKLLNRDRYIDKKGYEGQEDYESKEQLLKANEFFSSLQLPESIESGKEKCPNCGKFKGTYCLICGQLLINQQSIPSIILPLQLRVLHHNKEKHQKSSALPVQFLSPQASVKQFPVDSIEFGPQDYILYPHINARFLNELSQEELLAMKSITAIDCTWRQTNQIMKHLEEDISGQRKYIKLGEYETFFWRYQHHGSKCLATIEAIYYFFKEFSQLSSINLNYDILLYFYRMNFIQIHQNLQQEIQTNVYEKAQSKKQRRLLQKIDLKEKQKKQLTKI